MTAQNTMETPNVAPVPGNALDCAAAYSRWLAARARHFAPDLSEEDYDAAIDDEIAAARVLAWAPARYAEDVHHKIEVLEVSISEMVLIGRPADPVEPDLIAAIKADLFRLGIGGCDCEGDEPIEPAGHEPKPLSDDDLAKVRQARDILAVAGKLVEGIV